MQAKTKKKLLIVGWLAVFLLLVTTFSSVTVANATVTQCSDGIDNDGDTAIDINDRTCHSDGVATNTASYLPSKNVENEAPVITLLGGDSEIFVGDVYADQGATATDTEDGDITNKITTTTNTSTTTTTTITTTQSTSIIAVPQQAIPAPTVVECNYLLDYLRIDLANNPLEVMKLQKFLKENEDFANLQVNGVFNQATFDAVNIFQMKYQVDVLSPWGYSEPTGYVYITTKKKINELYCKRPFPLTQEQIDEIISVRNASQELAPITPIIGEIVSTTTESIATEPTQSIQGLVAGVSDEKQEEQENQEQSVFAAYILSNIPSAKTFLVIALILIILLVGLIIVFVAIRRRKRIVNAEELVIQ